MDFDCSPEQKMLPDLCTDLVRGFKTAYSQRVDEAYYLPKDLGRPTAGL